MNADVTPMNADENREGDWFALDVDSLAMVEVAEVQLQSALSAFIGVTSAFIGVSKDFRQP